MRSLWHLPVPMHISVRHPAVIEQEDLLLEEVEEVVNFSLVPSLFPPQYGNHAYWTSDVVQLPRAR
eukprot:4938690-Pyramimonas_sp.AAC.1